jgi:hypothetical protein
VGGAESGFLPESTRGARTGDPLHLFVHIPKCAGSTVEAFVARNFPGRYLYPLRIRAPARLLGRPHYRIAPQPIDHDKIDFVVGHYFGRSIIRQFPGRTPRAATLLRHPINRIFSHYNYRMQRYVAAGQDPVPFELWYRARATNSMSEFLLSWYAELSYATIRSMSEKTRYEALCALLDTFWFVGPHSDCGRLIALLADQYDVPGVFSTENVTQRTFVTRSSVSDGLRQQIAEENQLDSRLFERYCEPDRHPAHNVDGRLRSLIKDLQRPSAIIAYRIVRSGIAKLPATPAAGKRARPARRRFTLPAPISVWSKISLAALACAAAVAYLFWPNDLLPDAMAIGYLDDSTVALFAAFFLSVVAVF